MKFLALLFAALVILGPIFGFSFLPSWWDNPHGYFLNFHQAENYQSETIKPDLLQIKENLYIPFEATFNSDKYYGLITIKPEFSRTIKIGGAFYRDRNTDQLSLLDGKLVDKGTHYEVQFKSKKASELFKSKKFYQSHIEFPTQLEIRGYGKGNTPYLINPLNRSDSQTVRFLPADIEVEKPFLGQWKSFNAYGSWKFEFSALPGSQVTGFAQMEYGNKHCAYPIFGFPVGHKQMVFLTGDSTVQGDHCQVRSWISNSEDSPTLFFDPLNNQDYSLTLNKQ